MAGSPIHDNFRAASFTGQLQALAYIEYIKLPDRQS